MPSDSFDCLPRKRQGDATFYPCRVSGGPGWGTAGCCLARSHWGAPRIKPLRIGILAHDFLTWQGGTDFLEVVARSLLAAPGQPKLFLLIPAKGPRIFIRSLRLASRACLRSRLTKLQWRPPSSDYHRSELAALPPEVERVWHDVGKRPLFQAVSRHRLEVLLPSVHTLGVDFPVPWLGYAYDFQHRHLPQFFTEKDRRSRDSHFQAIFNDPPVTLVNSQAVARDARQLIQPLRSRICALPFTPLLRESWSRPDPSLMDRYGLSFHQPFFLVSNQFWPHKNHELVFRASAQLRRKGLPLKVLCTGAMDTPETRPVTHRLSSTFPDLLGDGTIRLLGWIPKRDQIGLLRAAAAVIQPSLLEGGPGGGASYHSVALGKTLLLSDIPVNREVNRGKTVFFSPDDPSALANAMQEVVMAPMDPPEPWAALQTKSNAAAKICGEVLENAIRDATQGFPPVGR